MELKIKIFIAFILGLTACKNNQVTESYPQEILVEIPEDFPKFYETFHKDSLFQIEHIVFPLSEKKDGSKFQKEEWVMHKPLDGSPEEYKIDFSNFANIITETISDTMGIFNMERRFSKMDNEWHLIYYSVKTKVFAN